MGRNRITKQKRFNITDMTYRSAWMIGVGGTLEELIKAYAKKIKVEPWEINKNPDRYAHFGGHSEHRGGLLWFKDIKPGAGAVAHESFHATYWFMKYWYKANLTDDTEELYAYFQEFLVREIGQRVW